MFVFRSLITGLAGACFVLLVMYEPPVIESRPASDCAHLLADAVATATSQRALPNATLVDVAASVPATAIASLVRLEPGEHVATVDDVDVVSDLAAGAAIAARAQTHSFVDLGVTGPAGLRRVLLLLH